MKPKRNEFEQLHKQLFEEWYNGSKQIPELAAERNIDPSQLSHAFTRLLRARQIERRERSERSARYVVQ